MIDLTDQLDAIGVRYSAALDAKPSKGPVTRFDALVDSVADVPALLVLARKQQAAIDAVKALADGWHARGEHDMKFSKTIPDEDIAMAILTDGAQKVENARMIREVLEAKP